MRATAHAALARRHRSPGRHMSIFLASILATAAGNTCRACSPQARVRHEAHAQHRARSLAGGSRRAKSGAISARSVPLRRLPHHQPRRMRGSVGATSIHGTSSVTPHPTSSGCVRRPSTWRASSGACPSRPLSRLPAKTPSPPSTDTSARSTRRDVNPVAGRRRNGGDRRWA